ncbi:LAME_0F18316g1_1 [Lachancea meyersii CBS 8951]|uniref:LAME_0F18316g1_1 n=1 Tax=Lachancea meyersii CBS 8951 TaxID=1266667 RepID=A0A1G4K0K1_9SACH|nr:LAME_0F18316g1_1 [Lachancea meyersii CBS 8951]
MVGEKTGFRSRKRRTARACEVCHARKVRCDAHERMPCTSCQTFGLVCRLREVKRGKNGGHEGHEELDAGAGAGAEPEGHGDLGHEQTVKDAVSNGMPYGDDYLRNRGVEPGVFVDAERRDRDRVHVYFGSSSFLSLLTGSSFPDESHFVSGQKLRHTLPRAGEGSPRVANMEILRISGAFLLPCKSICDELVNLYFSWIHPLMPLMDQTAFLKEYESNTCSIFLLQAMLCVGVKLSQNPLLTDKDGSTELASNIFYGRAKALYDGRYEENEIALLQGMILLSKQAFQEKNLIHSPLYYMKNAITVAHTHGLHRSADFHPTLTNNEKKTRKLIWWILYTLDTFASISIGRPQAIHLEDCDIPLLTHDDFVFDGQAPELITPIDYRDCVISTVQIAEIMSRVSRELNRPVAAPSDKKTVIRHFDVILQRWRENLPPTLSYNSNAEIFTKHSLPKAFVNAFYYKTLCLLHKSNIHDMDAASDEQYVSAGIAFQAAHSLSLIGQILLDRNELGYCYVGHAYCFFEAMIIFVHHMHDPDSIFRQIALKCYHVLERVLYTLGKQWNSCTLLSQILFAFGQNPEYVRAVIARFKAKMKDLKNPYIPIEVPSPARSLEMELQKLSPAHSKNWSSPPLQPPGVNAPNHPFDVYGSYTSVPPYATQPHHDPHMKFPPYLRGNAPVPYVSTAAPIAPYSGGVSSERNFTTTNISQGVSSSQVFDPHLLFPDVSQPLPADFHFDSNPHVQRRPEIGNAQTHDATGVQSSLLTGATDLQFDGGNYQENPEQHSGASGQEEKAPPKITSIPLPPGFWDSIQVNLNFFKNPAESSQTWHVSSRDEAANLNYPLSDSENS